MAVYQELANYSDNPLGYFKEFRKLDKASSRYRRGRAMSTGSTASRQRTRKDRGPPSDRRLRQGCGGGSPAAGLVDRADAQMSEHPDAPVPFGEA
jgi:phospholipase C